MYKILGIVALLSISFWCGYQWRTKCSYQVETDTINKLFLPVYSIDPNSYETRILDSIKIGDEEPLSDILKTISVHLSRKVFYNLPILLDSIIIQDDKKILYINLIESIGKKKWNRNLFQGSTGGYITSNTLLENFLQRDYHGEWIDGVHFSYEGVPITGDYFDHMGSLHGLMWRDSI